jgi:hypothetical protein
VNFRMKRRIVYILSASVVAVLMATAPAFAQPHAGHECEAPNHPGHTEYAEHHIVLLAQQQALGAGQENGHVPGFHQGFAGLCGVLAPEE